MDISFLCFTTLVSTSNTMSSRNMNSFGSSSAVVVCDWVTDISESESGSAERT